MRKEPATYWERRAIIAENVLGTLVRLIRDQGSLSVAETSAHADRLLEAWDNAVDELAD